MSDDLIKREDAIATIGVMYERCDTGDITDYRDLMLEAVKVLPTADRPQGEWIFKPLFPNDESEFPMGHLECSVCGSHHRNSTPCNYCDNCGARMKGADDE